MTDTEHTELRRVIIDAFGPFVLAFDKRGGYGIEIDGQRVRVEHLRGVLASYDAATGAQDGGPIDGRVAHAST